MKTNIHRLFQAMVAGFAVIVLALTNLTVFQRQSLVSLPFNSRRLAGWDSQGLRGGIYDRNGEVLAEPAPAGTSRHYPDSRTLAPVLGYLDPKLGASGLEARYAAELSGRPSFWSALGVNIPLFHQGEDLVLTVDKRVQQRAMRLLAGKRGAAVVLDPRSGAVLALASQPSFDLATVARDWEKLSRAAGAPLLNRATQGLYPPGSTLKLLTLVVALARDPGLAESKFTCPGKLELEGYTVHCPRAHGEIDLATALAVSCNVTFARLGLELGNAALAEQAEKAGFNSTLAFDLPVATSSFPRGNPGAGETAQRAIGQGQVLATPLSLALLAGGVAKDGIIMQPYLVAERRLAGRVVTRTTPRRMSVFTDPETAAAATRMLVEVTRRGTGSAAAIPGVEVAGKTGTAENPHGAPHAWYVGFAPAGEPLVVVAVVVENGGGGGSAAAPIGRELMELVLKEVR